MNQSFFNLLLRWVVLALGVVIAARIVPGISYDDGVTLLVVVLLLSFCNAVLRPLLLLFTLPFIILSAGLGVFIINAFLFYIVGKIVDGFHVAGFWPALGGSLIVSVTSMVLSFMLRPARRPQQPPSQTPPAPENKKGNDVIDI